MTTHLKGFGLENFRVFKDYTWFDFAPITVLTGQNSSGKSSLIKALLLLENSISKPGQLELEFSNDNVYQLGNFERIINNKSSDNTVSFHFPYQLQHFPTLGESYECQVAVTFKKKEGSILAEANEFSIKTENNLLLIYDEDKLYINFQFLLERIFLKSKDTFEIKKLTGIEELIYDDTKKYKGGFALINKTDTMPQKNFIGNLTLFSANNIARREKKEELDEILNFYSKEISFHFGKQETPLEIILEIPNEVLDELPDIDVQSDRYPLRTILRTYGLSDSLIEFIDSEVLGFSNQFLKSEWLNDLQKIQYQPAVRGKVNRIYRKEEKDVLNELITAFFENKVPKKNIDFLQKWSARFNLLGEVKPFLDSKYNVQSIEIGDSPLVEQGLGISQLVAVLLTIVTKEDNKKVFIFEEPEANLHPKFQSLLADMFIDAAKVFNIQFIIETHSEYLIRKLQYLIAKTAASPKNDVNEADMTEIKNMDDFFMANEKTPLKMPRKKEIEVKKEDIVIYYFHDPNNVPAGEPQVKKIEILEDGSLSSDFGSGFFDEATNWKFELMRLKNAQKN